MYQLTKVMNRVTYTDTNTNVMVDSFDHDAGYPFSYTTRKGNVIRASKVVKWDKNEDGSIIITTDLAVFVLKPFC